MLIARPDKPKIWGPAPWIVLCLLMGAGCAKIGEPQPPEVHIPEPAVDLAVRQLSDSVVLTVSKPVKNTDGSSVDTLRRVVVFRLAEDVKAGTAEQPLPEGQFLKRAIQIQSIPSASFSNYLRDRTFVIQDRITFAQGSPGPTNTFRYAVLFVNNKKQAAGISNQVRITPLPIPPPPEGISAEVTEDSIRLKWMVPTENINESKPARIAGYNIYRSEKPGAIPSAPINPVPIPKPEFEDHAFQFDRTYYYAVSTVGNLQDPYAESLPSKPCPVVARDVFPPHPPKDFSAVLQGGNVILLWAPSSSADVGGYRIYRQAEGTTVRRLLQDLPITVLSFRDTHVEPARIYEYEIQAVDTHGNESKAIGTEVKIP